ncbi:MAG: hypothetical protein JNL08_02430 [Planctomycetes bacterium]|nr:hypothetical protein [Planctomycetota bacterium]
MRPLLLAVVFLFAGCSSHRFFTPRENQNGTGPGGFPAAVYPLAGSPPAGEVRLWSRGADRTEADDAVELHIGFELENSGTEPLVLDATALQCDALWIEGLQQAPLAPSRVSGQTEARPGATASLDVWFRPPAETGHAIDGFAVRFRVAAGDRTVLAQTTPFVPWHGWDRWHDDRYFWYGGYGYRPHGYWGPMLGWGWYGRYCH